MGAYLPLFSFDVEHAFFSSGTPTDLDFLPTPRSSVILRNAGLIDRKTVTGVSIFYDQGRIDALQRYAADRDDPLRLEFKVFSKNISFDLYTEPSPTQPEAILYFDTKTVVADKGERFRLHEHDYVSQKDFIPITSPRLQDVLDPKDRLVRPMLMVTVHGEDIGLHSSGKFHDVVAQRYYIRFKSREVVWKYYLLGDMARKSAYIADVNNETEFESAGKAVVSDHRTALIFRSKGPIPLREKSPYRFQLKDRGPGGSKVLIQRLPVASPEQFYLDRIDGEDVMVSEIYINY